MGGEGVLSKKSPSCPERMDCTGRTYAASPKLFLYLLAKVSSIKLWKKSMKCVPTSGGVYVITTTFSPTVARRGTFSLSEYKLP